MVVPAKSIITTGFWPIIISKLSAPLILLSATQLKLNRAEVASGVSGAAVTL